MDLTPLQRRVDRFQQSHRPIAFVVGVAQHAGNDRGSQLAALLAYYGFLSLLPLLLVLTTLLRVVFENDPELQQRLLDTALAQVPVVGDDLAQVGSASGTGWVLAFGTIVALWAGLGVLDTVQDVLLTVWDIPPADRTGFFSRKLRSLGLILVLGAALGVTTVIGVVGTVSGDLPSIGRVVSVVLTAVLAGAVALTALVVLGGGGPPWRAHIPGAVVMGIGWVALQLGGTWFVTTRLEGASASYGTFGIVVGLMAWLYLLGWLVVFATELNVVLARRLWPVVLFPDAVEQPDREPGGSDGAGLGPELEQRPSQQP